MKPYIKKTQKDHQYKLICEYIGTSVEDLKNILLKNSIVAYELPTAQSLECTWELRLHLANGNVLAFSSKCTGVGGWDEVGSLNIQFEINNNETSSDVFSKVNIEDFYIDSYAMLIYEENDVYSESGICFIDTEGKELIVLAAPSPGAVSVSIPDVKTEIKPEFCLSDYTAKLTTIVQQQ